MKKVVLYIHGKGGNAGEARHYRPLFPGADVLGFDYQAQTPWDAIPEFSDYMSALRKEYSSVVIIANSIGVYYAMNAWADSPIEKAFFISPVIHMEQLIENMMLWSGVSRQELKERGTVKTEFGETLSWEYLCWVQKHPVRWNAPTSILYGKNDSLQSINTIRAFAENHNAPLTVMENGEHWFHTEEQMAFLDRWIQS